MRDCPVKRFGPPACSIRNRRLKAGEIVGARFSRRTAAHWPISCRTMEQAAESAVLLRRSSRCRRMPMTRRGGPVRLCRPAASPRRQTAHSRGRCCHADEASVAPMAQSWAQLVTLARTMDATALRAEFDPLFVATGTRNSIPTSRLTSAVSSWKNRWPCFAPTCNCWPGGVRGVTELEDHLGALCEAMRFLICDGRPTEVQRSFFDAHLRSWATRCRRISAAPQARFYRQLAQLADAFLAMEQKASSLRGRRGRQRMKTTPTREQHMEDNPATRPGAGCCTPPPARPSWLACTLLDRAARNGGARCSAAERCRCRQLPRDKPHPQVLRAGAL